MTLIGLEGEEETEEKENEKVRFNEKGKRHTHLKRSVCCPVRLLAAHETQ